MQRGPANAPDHDIMSPNPTIVRRPKYPLELERPGRRARLDHFRRNRPFQLYETNATQADICGAASTSRMREWSIPDADRRGQCCVRYRTALCTASNRLVTIHPKPSPAGLRLPSTRNRPLTIKTRSRQRQAALGWYHIERFLISAGRGFVRTASGTAMRGLAFRVARAEEGVNLPPDERYSSARWPQDPHSIPLPPKFVRSPE